MQQPARDHLKIGDRPLLVQKYGGTSVGSPERIRAVAQRIAHSRAKARGLVVVVSAMGHTTDELIDLAHQVSREPPHREMDMLLTTGERISMALLSMALSDLSVPAISLTGSQSGIITDGSHRRARIERILGNRIREALEAGQVAIVAGFQGVSEKKEITTLGRGGSDTTAVALAAALGADVCEIFTDVDGVFSADPRKVARAHHLDRVPHDIMVELATRGAGVLHPRSVEVAKKYGVPLVVRNSLIPIEEESVRSKGTWIVSRQEDGNPVRQRANGTGKGDSMEAYQVTGVTSDSAKFLVEVDLERPGAAAAVWDSAAKSSLPVVAPVVAFPKLYFFAERESLLEWKKALEHLVFEGFLKTFRLDDEQLPVSIVGDRFSQDGAVLARLVEILAQCGTSVTIASGSALAVTVAVPVSRADDAVQALHRALLEPQAGLAN
jgi:aspartate kinase